jgi:hypothetical protein
VILIVAQDEVHDNGCIDFVYYRDEDGNPYNPVSVQRP